MVASLVYLGGQVRSSNRLSRAEAWRASYDNLISLNAAFGVDPLFQDTLHRVLYERVDREALEPRARIVMGMYLTSVVNLYAQLHREVEEERSSSRSP